MDTGRKFVTLQRNFILKALFINQILSLSFFFVWFGYVTKIRQDHNPVIKSHAVRVSKLKLNRHQTSILVI